MATPRISLSDLAVNAETARAMIAYDPDTGIMVWKFRPAASGRWNTRYAGRVVGTLAAHGYSVTRFCGRSHYLHRLAWLMMTGAWPTAKVDHKNGIKTDNRWGNLRLVDNSQNNANQKMRCDNTSGHKGISWNTRDGLWEAYIGYRRKRHRLGRYTRLEDAIEARKEATVKLHGAFARTT